jgi:hypothetical protein
MKNAVCFMIYFKSHHVKKSLNLERRQQEDLFEKIY